eukprot:6913897-Alexandrium_andersonii.AAC.1
MKALDVTPDAERVTACAWGPVMAWKYVMKELGLWRVMDTTLSWTFDQGDRQAPRKDGWDNPERGFSFLWKKELRRHSLRNAWRRHQWTKWQSRSLRRDAGLARSQSATWQPQVYKALVGTLKRH